MFPYWQNSFGWNQTYKHPSFVTKVLVILGIQAKANSQDGLNSKLNKISASALLPVSTVTKNLVLVVVSVSNKQTSDT